MKLHRTAILAFLSSSVSAWAPNGGLSSFVARSATAKLCPPASISALLSTVASPDETTASPEATTPTTKTPFALFPSGKQIAEGKPVSLFQGGLVAVKIDDDAIFDSTPIVSPTVDAAITGVANSKTLGGGDLMGRQVVFANKQVGVVVAHRPPLVFVYTEAGDMQELEGSVKVMDGFVTLEIPEGIRAADCFGRTIEEDSTAAPPKTMKRPIFAPIPQVKDIALINKPLLSGVTMFDALVPIGKGQNMLLVGHDLEDMRRYVCDMLAVQSKQTKCVYATTTGKKEITKLLGEAGLLEDVVLISDDSRGENFDPASHAAEATVVAASACSVAEAFAIEKGMDTLVVIDNIDQHKKLWDATTRVLVDVFGVEAVVKGDRDGGASSEMRAFFSSLVQRSAQYKAKRGGGSVTLLLLTSIPRLAGADEDSVFSPDDFANSPAKVKERIELLVKRNVPLTAVNLRKIQIPIPSDKEGTRRLILQHVDDLISMSDGQIWLDEVLEAKGRRPAMDFQRSVTRIGIGADTESRADATALRRIVEGLRLGLSQVNDMDLGADSETVASKKQVLNALSLFLAMHQPSASGARTLAESCTALLAASKGYLNDVVGRDVLAGTDAGNQLMSDLFVHVSANARDAMNTIDTTQDLPDDVREDIEKAIKSFFDNRNA